MKFSDKIYLSTSTTKKQRRFNLQLLFFTASIIFPAFVYAQRVSLLIPEKTPSAADFAQRLAAPLADDFKILDDSLSETAYQSVSIENPYNLTTTQAKNIGTVIGCQYFLLIKSDVQQRVSLEEGKYFEAYAVVFTVSSRNGRLIFWRLESQKGKTTIEATNRLNNTVEFIAKQILASVKRAETELKSDVQSAEIEEIPAADSPEAKNFRPPLPFRRIKPKYTQIAYLYDVAATIDVLVDISEKGEILRTEIIRWAGYELEESVTETVKRMNWRAAERNGKFIPMRVLLRYNFKKIEEKN